MSVNDIHPEKETLVVEVNIPGHEPRVTTQLFHHTRQKLIDRENGRCWVCGRTAQESGHPLEAHHHPIERSLANMIDWDRFKADCLIGIWGNAARDFDWDRFDPSDPYTFVDDMTVNGELLCREHHTGRDEGKHDLPFPLWIAQRYGREGYRFSDIEIIHHEV
jgi:hypothetical protein